MVSHTAKTAQAPGDLTFTLSADWENLSIGRSLAASSFLPPPTLRPEQVESGTPWNGISRKTFMEFTLAFQMIRHRGDLDETYGDHFVIASQVAMPGAVYYMKDFPNGIALGRLTESLERMAEVLGPAAWPYFSCKLPALLKEFGRPICPFHLEALAAAAEIVGPRAGVIFTHDRALQLECLRKAQFRGDSAQVRAEAAARFPKLRSGDVSLVDRGIWEKLEAAAGKKNRFHGGFRKLLHKRRESLKCAGSPAEICPGDPGLRIQEALGRLEKLANDLARPVEGLPWLKIISGAASELRRAPGGERFEELQALARSTYRLVRRFGYDPVYNQVLHLSARLGALQCAFQEASAEGIEKKSARRSFFQGKGGNPDVWGELTDYWLMRYESGRDRASWYKFTAWAKANLPWFDFLAAQKEIQGLSAAEALSVYRVWDTSAGHFVYSKEVSPPTPQSSRREPSFFSEYEGMEAPKLQEALQDSYLGHLNYGMCLIPRDETSSPISPLFEKSCGKLGELYRKLPHYKAPFIPSLQIAAYLADENRNSCIQIPPDYVWNEIDRIQRQRLVDRTLNQPQLGLEIPFTRDELERFYWQQGSRLVALFYEERLAAFALVQGGRKNLPRETAAKIDSVAKWGLDYGNAVGWVYLVATDKAATKKLLRRGVDLYASITRAYVDVLVEMQVEAVYGRFRVGERANLARLAHERVGGIVIPGAFECISEEHTEEAQIVLLVAKDALLHTLI